jgi:hypothetical protein
MAGGHDLEGFDKWTSAARSWWDNGALVVDGAGAGLIDADGVRHPLPVPPWGGKLIMAGDGVIAGSAKVEVLYTVFIADEQNHVLVRLPGVEDGFDRADLRSFAVAAGLNFDVQLFSSTRNVKKAYPGLHKSLSLLDATRTHADRGSPAGARLTPDRTPADSPAGDDWVANAPGEVAAAKEAVATARQRLGHPSEMEIDPDVAPPVFSAEVVLHAAVAHHADEQLPYLVAVHDEDPARPPPAYADAFAAADADPLTDVREVDLAVETGAGRTLSGRFAEPQQPLPVYNGGGLGYRLRAAFTCPTGKPRLVAAFDEHAAGLASTDVAADPGSSGLPSCWADAVASAQAPLRECIIVVAEANWAAALKFASGPISAFLV